MGKEKRKGIQLYLCLKNGILLNFCTHSILHRSPYAQLPETSSVFLFDHDRRLFVGPKSRGVYAPIRDKT